jgi:hypothetical protein
MDWTILFEWLEQKTGVSYDLNDAMSDIDGDTAFSEPFLWYINISFVVEDMENAIQAVEDFRNELTEDLPSKTKIQKFIENEYIRRLTENINNVKKQLGMAITPIRDAADVATNVTALYELISTMETVSIENLKTREWFEKYDEANDNVLTDVLELHQNDLIDIHQTIETIVESLNDDDDDDDDDIDADLEEDV